jgi:hypothetical protein
MRKAAVSHVIGNTLTLALSLRERGPAVQLMCAMNDTSLTLALGNRSPRCSTSCIHAVVSVRERRLAVQSTRAMNATRLTLAVFGLDWKKHAVHISFLSPWVAMKEMISLCALLPLPEGEGWGEGASSC